MPAPTSAACYKRAGWVQARARSSWISRTEAVMHRDPFWFRYGTAPSHRACGRARWSPHPGSRHWQSTCRIQSWEWCNTARHGHRHALLCRKLSICSQFSAFVLIWMNYPGCNRKYPGTSTRCIPFSLRAMSRCPYIHPEIRPAIPAATLSCGCAWWWNAPYPLETSFHKQPDVVDRINAGIQTEQARLVCNLPRKLEQFRKKGGHVFLAVLLPFSQLAGKQISFRPDIRIMRSW